MYRLENWAIATSDPYSPPETGRIYLTGEVYGHPKYPDGYEISTSRPVKSEGRVVTTYSGSIYLLGSVDPAYLEFLEKAGRKLDEENPIKIINNE